VLSRLKSRVLRGVSERLLVVLLKAHNQAICACIASLISASNCLPSRYGQHNGRYEYDRVMMLPTEQQRTSNYSEKPSYLVAHGAALAVSNFRAADVTVLHQFSAKPSYVITCMQIARASLSQCSTWASKRPEFRRYSCTSSEYRIRSF